MIKDGRVVHFAYYHIFVHGERVTHLSQALTDKPARLRIERRKGKIHAAFSQNEGKSWSSGSPSWPGSAAWWPPRPASTPS